MQKTFKKRIYKISLDGGFSCPNRDGKKSFSGCIFCDAKGSSSRTNDFATPIKEQAQNNIRVRKSRYNAEKFIAYFQSFTNTYAPVEILKKRYDEAISAHPDIIGLTISTRPDCIDKEKIELIASYKQKLPYVSIEYGMQTIHDKTLNLINRKETHSDFLKALELTKQYQLHHCAHVILNLPGETKEEMLETADRLAQLEIEGVKIHLLVAMKGTALEKLFLKGLWRSFSLEEYVKVACDFLERLPPETVIHRISKNGHPQEIAYPLWMKEKKREFMPALLEEFQKRNSCQGALFKKKQN